MLDRIQPEWVINCAALANLEACEAKPDLAKKVNRELPENLAKYVARGGARLVHISTDAIFDGRRGEYTEEDQPNPLSHYARTKYDGEIGVLKANPEAIVARVNLFGWSLSGKRSLAEWFFNNLSAGNNISGFTDVFFCPLLATYLADILLKMLAREMQGLYHVVSSDCISKYDFGLLIAEKFNFDQALIEPVSVKESDLRAERSLNLTLKADKISQELRRSLPTISQGIDQFQEQFTQGYPQLIRSMAE
jgi:dTDP-4-dehydrorhamnose reductase